MSGSSLLPVRWRELPPGPVAATVAVGVAYASHDGFDVRPVPLALCLLAALAGHLGITSFMAILDPDGARPAFLPAALLAATGLAFGLSAAVLSQPIVFLAGVAAAVAAISLVLPVLPLAYLGSGVGEGIVFTLAGPLPTLAAYASQGGSPHVGVLAASAPGGFFATAVLLLVHGAFADTDAAAGRRTLVTPPGPASRWIPWGSAGLAYLSLAALVLWGEFPRATLWGVVTSPAAVATLAVLGSHSDGQARLRAAGRMGWTATCTLAIVAAALAAAE